MKKLILFISCFSILQLATAQRAVIDKVVAMVGGEIILLSEIEEQYSLIAAKDPNVQPEQRCSIMEQLMAVKLLVNQARLDSIDITDEEIEEQLNARIDQILTYMNDDREQFRAYYGQTVPQVKEQFRSDLIDKLLSERMRASVLSSVKVTPAEVKGFFHQIPQDSLPFFGSEVEVGEIIYHPPVNDDEQQKATLKLENIKEQIKTGVSTFEEMAQKFSDDGSARIGGDLGWAKRGKFVPEFEAAAYNLEVGEISPIVHSEFGFHIIQLIERRGNSIHVRHILVRPDITSDDLDLAKDHLSEVRTQVSTDSITFSRAVKRYSNEDEQSYSNDGRMMNPATGNTFFEVAELDPDIYFTIDTMSIGDISTPFSYSSPSGETFYRIVQLQSRTAPHRANLQEDYHKIQEATIQSKQSEFLSEWIEGKLATTYIHIDSQMEYCPNVIKWKADSMKP